MLTAAEWNERYPVGTPVLCRVGGRRTVTLTTHPAGVDPTGRSADQVYTEDVGWLNLSDVEPLATDAERLAAGWLDPKAATAEGMRLVREYLAETDRLRRERDEACARLNEVSNDRLAQLRRFAAEQPVIDAARAWLASRSLVEEYNMDDDEIRLEAAVKALDAAEAEPC